MKGLSIQVQPHRTESLDLGAVQAACEAIARLPLVTRHRFDQVHDEAEYINFNLYTEDLPALWREVQSRLYKHPYLGSSMAASSIVVCEGDAGWNDYRLLYHFDPTLARDGADE